MTRLCSDCSTPISLRNRSGRCRPCSFRASLANPVVAAKRLERVALAARNPEVRKRMSEGVSRYRQARMASDPRFAEQCRERGRELARSRAGNAACPPGSEARLRAGAKIRAKRLCWCPLDRQDEYIALMRTIGASEARRIILDDIAAQRARLTPFERQMEALKRGADLVNKPVFAPREYDFTLGGVSSL